MSADTAFAHCTVVVFKHVVVHIIKETVAAYLREKP